MTITETHRRIVQYVGQDSHGNGEQSAWLRPLASFAQANHNGRPFPARTRGVAAVKARAYDDFTSSLTFVTTRQERHSKFDLSKSIDFRIECPDPSNRDRMCIPFRNSRNCFAGPNPLRAERKDT